MDVDAAELFFALLALVALAGAVVLVVARLLRDRSPAAAQLVAAVDDAADDERGARARRGRGGHWCSWVVWAGGPGTTRTRMATKPQRAMKASETKPSSRNQMSAQDGPTPQAPPSSDGFHSMR